MKIARAIFRLTFHANFNPLFREKFLIENKQSENSDYVNQNFSYLS